MWEDFAQRPAPSHAGLETSSKWGKPLRFAVGKNCRFDAKPASRSSSSLRSACVTRDTGVRGLDTLARPLAAIASHMAKRPGDASVQQRGAISSNSKIDELNQRREARTLQHPDLRDNALRPLS